MRPSRWIAPLVGIIIGAAYGGFARWFFAIGSKSGWDKVFSNVSIAFLFLVPFALGVLAAALAPRDLRRPWAYWVLAPAASTALLLVGALAFLVEGLLCLAIAAPMMILIAMLGGVAVGLFVQWRNGRRVPPSAVASCLVLPFVFAPAEARLPRPDDRREVTTSIDIAAPPSAVWRQVVRVPTLTDAELSRGFFQWIGIPQPLEATLSHDGVGGLREARFVGGIRFHERVTEWEADRRLGFTIEVDPASIDAAVLDPHVRVGGDHFDVVYGRFELVPHGTGTRLVLLSHHHLRTRFNAYSGVWTDAIMRDIQENICRVIRARSEAHP